MNKFAFGRCFGLVLGTVVSATALASFGVQAATVIHEGEILDTNVNPLDFSMIYRSSDGYGGGWGGGRDITGDIAYTWNTGADNTLSTGDTATFNIQDTKVYSTNEYGYRFDVTLLNSEDSVLTVGSPLGYNAGNGVDFVTHTIGGSLDFKIEAFYGNGNLAAIWTDNIIFDTLIEFSLVNGIRDAGAGSVAMYLWGDTRSEYQGWYNNYPGDGGGSYDYDCSGNSYACYKIKKAFYGSEKNMVWKLAMNGSVTPVPVPGALPLLVSALAGFGFLARRRRSAA